MLGVSGREGLEVWFVHLLCGDGVDGLGPGEDVESEVAAAFGPFVVLLGQNGADETDDAGPVGEDADDVGAAADLAVKSLGRVVRPDLAPDLLRERGEGEHVGAGTFEVLGDVGEFLLGVLSEVFSTRLGRLAMT